jgi:predicted cupin superfamily sugar epimerase
MTEADRVAEALGLEPHPEGGRYRQTWAAPAPVGERPSATAIHFLLARGERSHWHRVDAHEVWLWHAGGPLALSLAATEAGPARVVRMGGDALGGESPQAVVSAGWWQAARPLGDWALVSCVVAPGFGFEGFELAPAGFDIPSG